MIRWPERAFDAIRKLFEPLQDIDIFVEDVDDEVFYTQLFKRVASGQVRVARVFALGNRDAVVDKANAHDPSIRPALFVIDGDLEWVNELPAPSKVPWLYRLDAYCIENLLICEVAVTKIFMEDQILDKDTASAQLKFSNWLETIRGPLIDLFSAFAVINLHDPSRPTISTGVGNLCVVGPSRAAVLSPQKVDAVKQEMLAHAARASNEKIVSTQYERIRVRANALKSPLDIVSGKDFIFPLLGFLLQSHGCRIRHKVLRYRLALSCGLERFNDLLGAMKRVAVGNNRGQTTV